MSPNKNSKIWILIALTGAVIAAALLLWIIPSVQKISDQVAALQRERSEINLLQKKQAAGTQPKTFDPYQTGAAQLKQAAVTENSVINLIETLEKIAGETGVSAQLSVQGQDDKKTTPTPTAATDQKNPAQKTETKTNEIKLQLLLAGTWPKLLATLKKIENLPAVVDVTELSFHGSAGGTNAPTEIKTQIDTTAPTATLSLTIPLLP